MDDRKIFGENLRFLRKKNHLTQKQMASLLHVSTYCIQKAEHGIFVNSLYIDTLLDISRQFHIRITLLFKPWEEWEQED